MQFHYLYAIHTLNSVVFLAWKILERFFMLPENFQNENDSILSTGWQFEDAFEAKTSSSPLWRETKRRTKSARGRPSPPPAVQGRKFLFLALGKLKNTQSRRPVRLKNWDTCISLRPFDIVYPYSFNFPVAASIAEPILSLSLASISSQEVF